MKRTLLFFFALVVATMSMENMVNEIASVMLLPKEDVIRCVKMINVTKQDLTYVGQIITHNLPTDYLDYSARRAGCFYACITEASGVTRYGRINKTKLEEIFDFHKSNNKIAEHKLFEIFYNCGQNEYTQTDRCEMNFMYLYCVAKERTLRKI